MFQHPLRILLVEDDELFRLGLQVCLHQQPEIEILVEASDGEMAIDLAMQQPFDLVLLDIGLLGLGGVETCRQLKQNHPNLLILVLTSRLERSLISRMVEAGAQGYCLKGIPADKLVLAIQSIMAGASWWDATATTEIRSIFQHHYGGKAITNINVLTPREQEILLLVAQRLSFSYPELTLVRRAT